MSSGNSDETPIYRDELPPGCPPEEAKEITTETICYRLVRNDPPADEDFRSQRTLEPNRDFGVSECRAKGLSVFMQPRDATGAANRSRNLRGAKVAQLILNTGSGYIKKIGGRSHHTWWPYKAFDILANCEVIK